MAMIIVYGMSHATGPVETFVEATRPMMKFSNGYIKLLKFDDDIGRHIYEYSEVVIAELDLEDDDVSFMDFDEQLKLAMEEWGYEVSGLGLALVSDGGAGC